MDIFDRDHVKSKKRDAIVKMAGQLFCAKGYGSVSIDEIAGRLGVAKTVIYYQFDNKADLFKACHISSTELLENSLTESEDKDSLKWITSFIRSYVPTLIGEQGPGAVLLDLDMLPDVEALEISARRDVVYEKIRSLIDDAGRMSGVSRPDGAAAIFTKVLMGGINVLPKWYVAGSSCKWGPELIADTICDMVERWALSNANPAEEK